MNNLVSYFLKKYLSSPRKEWLRADSVFMITGIIISVATLTIALALFDGYEKAMKRIYFGVNSHIYIFNRQDSNLDENLQNKLDVFLQKQPEVESFAPIISNQVMASANGRIKGCFVRGINWQISPQPTTYRKFVTEGSYELNQPNQIVIGYKIAKELGLTLQDTIKLISPLNAKATPFGMKPNEQEFVVIGLYRSGMHEYDSKYAFCDINSTATFFNLDNQATMYEVKLSQDYIEKADYLAYKWLHELNLDFQISSWLDFNGNLFSLLALEKWVIFIILSFLIIIASFNVISAVSATILDKRRELGILKAFGTPNRVLKKILIGKTMIISFIAICLGQLLGMLISFLLSKQTFLQLKGDIYFIDSINIDFDIFSWLVTLTTSLIIVFFASVVPLKRIEKLQVTDILRGSGK